MEKAIAIQKQVIEILGTDEVYLVGGSVRDLVMGNKPKDYDFTTSLLPEEMTEKVKAAGRRVYTIGERFGTIGFKVALPIERVDLVGVTSTSEGLEVEVRHDKVEYEYVEVTTFRSEVYTSKSRKPEVAFVTSLDEDLARRDFTMNAMVLRPDRTIYDPYGGKLDIHAKLIKTVGLPKDRIQEDPLRMLRAARFAARYGFDIDVNFIGKARQLADRIYDVSVERWVQELDKLLTSDHYLKGMKELDQMGLLYRILPELSLSELSVRKPSLGEDVDSAWQQLLDDPINSKKMRNYINSGVCARLKFSNTRTSIIIDRA